MAQKHLIIDAQLWQTSDRKRGMGLFLSGLVAHLDQTDIADYQLLFIVNSRLPDLSSEEHELVKNLQAKIVSIGLLHRGDNEEFRYSLDSNKTKLDEVLKETLGVYEAEKTYFFIPALFSSEIHPVFPTSATTNILLFHDLIPFLYHKNYFTDHESVHRKDYAQRFKEFYRTDLFVTNSQTTADDLMVYFGVDPSRISPILGAAASRGHLEPKQPSKLGLVRDKFVLMPSGDDFRKNNIRAVRAFADLKSDLKLVITSRFSQDTQRTLRAIYPNVIFPGVVSDDEFLWLLDNAKVVYFPPEYEGLGMPLLEAVDRGVNVVCSNIPVFVEISSTAFTYFDPRSVGGMTDALKSALNAKSGKSSERKQEYERIRRTFSWDSVARSFMDGLPSALPAPEKQKLAVFCPSPSSYSSVGKYAFEIHAELSRAFDIDYYAEDGLTVFQPTRPNILEYAADYYPAITFGPEKARDYDFVLYNLGNSEFHIDTILNALRLPANAIVHDTRLKGIFDWLTRHGFLTTDRRNLESRLDEVFKTTETSCLVSTATNQNALICHSSYAEDATKKLVTNGSPKVSKVMHPIGVPEIQLMRTGRPTVSFAGIISEDKGISLVHSIAKSSAANVKIFGFGIQGDGPLLQNLGENVELIKDLTDKEFQDALQQTDILVNYRPNYNGETSRSTLEAMRHGAVVIVKDIGWYGELPDEVVVKVNNEAEVLGVINRLIENDAERLKIAEAARAFLKREYSYKTYAQDLAASLERS